MNVARQSASATVLDGSIYVAGGYTNVSKTNSVEVYDPKINEWTQVAPMNMPRCRFGLIASNGFLLAMGDDRAIEKFDPRTNWWIKVCEFERKQ